MAKYRIPIVYRFRSFVEVDDSTGCWLWTGAINRALGYGRIGVGSGVHDYAHRVSYTLFKGPIPEGTEIDHTCHNADLSCKGGPGCMHKRCVNPDHLEAVPHKVNMQRARNPRHLKCPHGHIKIFLHLPDGAVRGQCKECLSQKGKLRQATRDHKQKNLAAVHKYRAQKRQRLEAKRAADKLNDSGAHS